MTSVVQHVSHLALLVCFLLSLSLANVYDGQTFAPLLKHDLGIQYIPYIMQCCAGSTDCIKSSDKMPLDPHWIEGGHNLAGLVRSFHRIGLWELFAPK